MKDNIKTFIERINHLEQVRQDLVEQITALETDFPFIAACQKRMIKKSAGSSKATSDTFKENGELKIQKDNGFLSKRVDIKHIDQEVREYIIKLSKEKLKEVEAELSKYAK